MNVILEQLTETINKVIVWNDNATSQFKNQYIIESLKKLEKQHKREIKLAFSNLNM